MRGIESLEGKLAGAKERCESTVKGFALVAERYHPRVTKTLLTTGGALLVVYALNFGADQGIKPINVEAGTQGIIPPTATPFSPQPRIIIPFQPKPTPEKDDVVIVRPETVKPEVCKPEVVKVPEPVYIQVPVEPKPDPNIISLHRNDFNNFVEERAKIIAEDKLREVRQKSDADIKTAEAAQQKAEAEAKDARAIAEDAKKWRFDWWSGLLGGIAGLGAGATLFTRRTVVHYLHKHGHIHIPPPPPPP